MARAVAVLPGPDSSWLSKALSRVGAEAPSRLEWLGTALTTLLLILSFPNFNLPFLAWIALIPLLFVIAQRPSAIRAFLLGWIAGSVFFYCTCYWLTYSMIHYGGLPPLLAYLLLAPGALVVGIFPALVALTTVLAIERWNTKAILLTPFFWVACEWARLGITGQLWNALGYSQAEASYGIFPARFGGVYAISFLIVLFNAALAFVIGKRTSLATLAGLSLISLIPVTVFLSQMGTGVNSAPIPYLYVVAVQPNVPMSPTQSTEESEQLLQRHLQMSTNGLQQLPADSVPRLVVWPESPMNFTFSSDKTLQAVVAKFTRENHTSLLLNSLEPAPKDGAYNSALLINEDGRLIAQYDKIRLMPFGEYVPLPYWLGGSLISGIVGDFTPGKNFTLMPIAGKRAGTFICIESAYPSIARQLSNEGADFLINISNDGYLGPTAVMRQHLANAVFRAVENGRPLLRVTNSGLSAFILPNGQVKYRTKGFQADVLTWPVTSELTNETFYTKHGDLFAALCTAITILLMITSVYRTRIRRQR